MEACIDLVSPRPGLSAAIYDVVIGLPSLVFIVYLGYRLLPSYRKLMRSQSQIMATYYVFLWVVCLLNLVRCLCILAQSQQRYPNLWNFFWLLTSCGLVLLEVSVVVFLLQGYLTSGREALVRTLWISGSVALVDAIIKLVYIYGLHIPLFLYKDAAHENWTKWGYWLAHSMVFLLIYIGILILPHSKWRERLPAKPSFYRYIFILLVFNLCAVLGSILVGSKVVSGYCLYGFAHFLYYVVFAPLLYITFLAEFFTDTETDMDLLYYSEMKDAGYFDDFEEMY